MGGTGTGAAVKNIHYKRKKPTLEDKLKKRGFKEINILNWQNPISEYDLKYCLKNLLYETIEHKAAIIDFAILPNREATGNELASRGYYRVYVLPV